MCFFSALLLFINCYSVSLATGVQNVFTAAKLVAIVVICIGGIYSLALGPPKTLNFGFQGTIERPGAIAMAFYSGLWVTH